MNAHSLRLWVFPAVLALTACHESSNDDTTGEASGSDTPALTVCESSSWVAGTTAVCSGVLTYRDYIYDDHGADTSPVYNSPIGTLSPALGDATYPEGSENTADLVKLQLQLEGNDILVSAELNTLYEAESTLLGIAFDTDNNAETGGGDWGELNVSSDGWEVIYVIDRGDPDSNVLSGRFPRPEGDVWRVQAAVAQAEGTVMNVAFRPDEIVGGIRGDTLFDGGTWWEDRQAAALGAGDISEFGYVINVASLSDAGNIAPVLKPGLNQRVYTSQYTLPPGEGVSVDGVPGRHGDTGNPCEQYFNFLGKYQPYGIYIPDQAGPHGLQFVLHGCGANHASLLDGEGMQGRFGEDLNRILIVPLARGPQGYYSDISERDVLDVYRDVLAHYEIDREQIFAGGYSMGGYGGMRFASLYPDIFAGLVNWVGFTGDIFNTPLPGNPIPPETSEDGSRNGAVGNVIDFIGNMRHIPSTNLYAGEDELVHVNTALALMDRYGAVEVPYEFYLHPTAEHLTFAALDDWQKEAAYSAGRTRVAQPARVTYRTDEALDFPEYGITHDRAYWVSGIAGRDAGYIDIDITSHGCGGEIPVYSTGQDAGVGPLALTWTRTFREQTGTEALPADNRVEAELANVAEFAIDVTQACLSSDPLSYSVTTDGPVTIHLSDGRTIAITESGTHNGML